jgi:DNA-directed RNA polymerase subunit H
MHTLQPKHEKLSEKDVEKLLDRLNISLVQLPKISKKDPALSEDCKTGDVVKISRADEVYYRMVV